MDHSASASTQLHYIDDTVITNNNPSRPERGNLNMLSQCRPGIQFHNSDFPPPPPQGPAISSSHHTGVEDSRSSDPSLDHFVDVSPTAPMRMFQSNQVDNYARGNVQIPSSLVSQGVNSLSTPQTAVIQTGRLTSSDDKQNLHPTQQIHRQQIPLQSTTFPMSRSSNLGIPVTPPSTQQPTILPTQQTPL